MVIRRSKPEHNVIVIAIHELGTAVHSSFFLSGSGEAYNTEKHYTQRYVAMATVLSTILEASPEHRMMQSSTYKIPHTGYTFPFMQTREVSPTDSSDFLSVRRRRAIDIAKKHICERGAS